jgi:SAM-dependent methyltransferase
MACPGLQRSIHACVLRPSPTLEWKGVRRVLEQSAERGIVDRLLRRLPPDEAKRVRQRLRRFVRPARLGTLRRTAPLSHDFGYDRGTPVDRYYIERFLAAHRHHVRGHVLEVKESMYTDRFGSGVIKKDVLDIDPGNPLATVVADLASADSIPDAIYDCFILTQTLQLIYDARSAISHARRILKPGGALLVTVPVVSQIVDDNHLTDYWRFTVASCTLLFEEAFGSDSIRVRPHGNVLSAIAFLTGMAQEELTSDELEASDSRYAILISVCALKE